MDRGVLSEGVWASIPNLRFGPGISDFQQRPRVTSHPGPSAFSRPASGPGRLPPPPPAREGGGVPETDRRTRVPSAGCAHHDACLMFPPGLSSEPKHCAMPRERKER